MDVEKLSEFVRKKGIFFPSAEIYGGFTGFYDYGSNGTLIKRKFENLWRKYFLGLNGNFFEIETSDVMPENVFLASGHIQNFVDPVAKCKNCGTHHRADQILEDFLKENFEGMTPEKLTELIRKNKVKCPKCKGELGDVSILNMMFQVGIGADKNIQGYLRPETAQGAYINFSRHFNILRNKLPLGLAIIGKAFRNEISPRNLTTRMREFTQAELQIFFDPQKIEEHERWNEVKNYKLVLFPVANRGKKPIEISCENAVKELNLPKFYVWHLAKVQQFYFDVLKIRKENFRFKELSAEERAFYNKIHWDIEINLESLGGFKEVGGVHYRTDHDLSGHARVSGQNQEVFFDNRKFVPHVLELSFGVDRNVYALIELGYCEDKDRTVLSIPSSLAPFQIAIFPLMNKPAVTKIANQIFEILKNEFAVVYDDSGSIGKRYYREDERGTNYCITVDFDSAKSKDVTVRDRYSTKQIRVKIDDLYFVMKSLIEGKEKFEKAGKLVK